MVLQNRFSGLLEKGLLIGLVGDSIIEGIRRNELSYHVNHMSIFVKTFSGAATDDKESYIVPTLKRA